MTVQLKRLNGDMQKESTHNGKLLQSEGGRLKEMTFFETTKLRTLWKNVVDNRMTHTEWTGYEIKGTLSLIYVH